MRVWKALLSIVSQARKMARRAADGRSWRRFVTDVVAVHLCHLLGRPLHNRRRTIRLRDGVRLTYRFNSGDLQSIREVWLDEAYRLPTAIALPHDVLVDLGANIGLTSLWLAKHYGFSTLIAVEPSPANAQLVRWNLEHNGVRAHIVEAAVGPQDGTVFFQENVASNMGAVASSGRAVPMLSMESVGKYLPEGARVDLVKLDIEGGEEALLQGDLDWLQRVRAIIAEFHPDSIDYPAAIRTIEEQGFDYLRAGSAHTDSMDTFVQRAPQE